MSGLQAEERSGLLLFYEQDFVLKKSEPLINHSVKTHYNVFSPANSLNPCNCIILIYFHYKDEIVINNDGFQ